MGLLGNFNFDDPESMGLLTAGLNMIGNSGKGGNMNTAQILAGGVGAGMNGAAGVIQARQMMAMQKQKQEHDDLVMQSMKMENMQRQSQMESQQRLQDFQKTFSAQQQDPHAQAMQSMGGNLSPTVANAGTLNQLQAQAADQASDPYAQRMKWAKGYRSAGFQQQAEAEETAALKFQPKVKEWVDSTVNGQAVKVPYFEDGTYGKPSAIPIAKALHFQDTGGGWSGLDSFTGQKVASGNKTQTLESLASERSASATRAQSERHFNAGQTTPQYMETENGIVALPKKLDAGQSPVGIPVTDQNGQSLKKKQNIPQYVVEGISGNAKSLSVINSALSGLETPEGKNATGWKGYLPNSILARTNPEGVNTRADISDIGSLVLHDRSGAAVTAAESPRLMPFIPLAMDDAATAKKKLTRFKQLVEAETNNLTFAYPGAKSLADFANKPADKKEHSSIDSLLDKYK